MTVRYAPYADPRQRRKPGLAPMDPADWIEVDGEYAAQMAYRDRLVAEQRGVVFAEVAGSAAAQVELLAMLRAHLSAVAGFEVREASVLRPDGTTILTDSGAPVVVAGRLVQEDFCILEKGAERSQAKRDPVRRPGSRPEEAEYVLTSAILCFPSRWSLAEKIGQPLTAIHDPVPDYTDDLAKRVNRVFDGVKVGMPLWRANWTVHGHDEPHQPSGSWRREEVGDGLFIRVERQTFVRLPQTQAVVFGIRTYIDPLEALAQAQASALLEMAAAHDADEIDYRGGDALHAKVVARLRELAA